MRDRLLGHGSWVSDGGLETDLIHHRGVPLEQFAAYPLALTDAGREVLAAYYAEYAGIARAAGVGLLLEAPTWRASHDWGAVLGHDDDTLGLANRAAIELMREVADASGVERVLVSGTIGPRSDERSDGGQEPDVAAEYHAPQLEALAAAGADLAHALTLAEPGEAVGVVRAARAVGLPVAISFTVETDGRLPDGTPLGEAVAQVDELAAADWYGVNCAHPSHVRTALDGGAWQSRVASLRPNASGLSHEELEEMTTLDTGDIGSLAAQTVRLAEALGAVSIRGGCCGTDARHVAAMWADAD